MCHEGVRFRIYCVLCIFVFHFCINLCSNLIHGQGLAKRMDVCHENMHEGRFFKIYRLLDIICYILLFTIIIDLAIKATGL